MTTRAKELRQRVEAARELARQNRHRKRFPQDYKGVVARIVTKDFVQSLEQKP